MYRGGNWNNGASAGVFYLNGNNSRGNANTNFGFRAALALFVYFLRAKAQQKHQGKRDAFPGRQGQRYTLVLLCRWRPPGTPSKPRRLAVVCYAGRRGDPDPAAWRPQRKDLAEECHNAGHNYDNTRRNEDMDPRNQPSLLERIYSWENLLDAYHEAASEKWYRNDVTAFAANLEENLISIQNDLIWHTYKVGRYRQFYVHEPKKRLVMALGFRDRVVQWAIYLQTNQHLDNGMIYHSYGCRVGKGTTRAADRLQYWCTLVDRKPGKWYYLKLDVSKYFYRVDHRVLLDILRRKFPNEDGYLWLMETIINCDHTPFGLPPGKSADEIPPSERLFEVGMPIGNLTSQLLANVCLNELDQYIKHELKAHFYDRYMDDMALLYPDAATLNRWRAAIEKYLNEVLHLELNSKTTIGLVKHGITFVGCRIYPGYRKPTAQSVKKMKARMRYIAKEYEAGLIDFDAVDATMQSYFGLMGHCSTHGLQKWIEKNIIFKRKEMADIELPQEVTQWELNQF